LREEIGETNRWKSGWFMTIGSWSAELLAQPRVTGEAGPAETLDIIGAHLTACELARTEAIAGLVCPGTGVGIVIVEGHVGAHAE
jgi:hypothetical protein